jgi:hypothetical protein
MQNHVLVTKTDTKQILRQVGEKNDKKERAVREISGVSFL